MRMNADYAHAYNVNMTEELSGVTIVIFIAAGVLTILLLFIFAKRQIMRFALRSRRGPHIPIGHDTRKVRVIVKVKLLTPSTITIHAYPLIRKFLNQVQHSKYNK